MPRSRSYHLDRVLVEAAEARPATWTFGGTPQQGVEQAYRVTDTNFSTRNGWEFVVRLPKRKGDRVEVRPRATPNVKAWAELPDRSITFMRATLGDSRGRWYCPVALADPSGERSRTVVRAEERDRLPRWFRSIAGRMRVKEHVKRTAGTDGRTLVLLVTDGDHAGMIRLFFALKVWVLAERFVMDR